MSILTKESQKLANISQLTLHVNIDGIPLFNNSKTALWPILGCVVELNALVFPIALFCSNKKPTSIEEYLKNFVLEIKELESAEFVNSETSYSYKIKLGAVICDTPAQAFVKCIKSHNSCNCCECCTQHGEYYHKIILPDMFTSYRTDSSFFQRSDPHVGNSPLTELSFGMITGFPLDYMHLVCLGVVRRLINLWLHGPFTCKLSQTIISEISDKLVMIQPYISREFSRKPRALFEFKQWKATELRQFLLYTGPVILKKVLPKTMYKHFLYLSIAIRILLSSSLIQYYTDYAGQLLQYFVQIFSDIYGKDQIVYNVHSLIHLADDAKQFGVLDNCSSFKYESYL